MNLTKGILSAAVLLSVTMAYGQSKQKAAAKAAPTPAPATKAAEPAPAPAKKHNQSLHDQFSGTGYGMAGCGLGSIVFGQKPGMVQIFAATTNNTYSNNTFGISSGTSNCGESAKAAAASQFIDVNKVALETDLSRGQGETVASLAKVLECKNQNFASTMKNEYQSAFPAGGATSSQIHAVAYKACEI